jgi:hypothetical protein
MITKKETRAFGKTIYLLGQDKNGINYWLEGPSWECSWYWGFGYIETYTNNNSPEHSKDISSHSHASNFMAEYFTELNGSKPILTKTVFTEDEGWELSELFKQFYHWRDHAELLYRGNMNITTATDKLFKWKDEVECKRINKEVIPKITARIIEILKPNN